MNKIDELIENNVTEQRHPDVNDSNIVDDAIDITKDLRKYSTNPEINNIIEKSIKDLERLR